MAGNGRFRRTTSMTGFTVDFEVEAAGGPALGLQVGPVGGDPMLMDLGSGGLGAMVSPRYDNRRRRRRNSCEENMATQFLRSCGLCQRRLAPGRDIYMYRGDTAFCSLECREQQIKNDDRKNKCSTVVPNYSDASAANSDTSGGNTGTFAVA